MKDRILLALFAINEYLYNYKSQVTLSLIWISAFFVFDTYDFWVKAGLISWLCLIVVRSFQAGFKSEIESIRQVIRENGFLPLLVGLNLCVIMGPLAIFFSLALAFTMKNKK